MLIGSTKKHPTLMYWRKPSCIIFVLYTICITNVYVKHANCLKTRLVRFLSIRNRRIPPTFIQWFNLYYTWMATGAEVWTSDHQLTGSNPLRDSFIINFISISPALAWAQFSLSNMHKGGLKQYHFMYAWMTAVITEWCCCRNITWPNHY